MLTRTLGLLLLSSSIAAFTFATRIAGQSDAGSRENVVWTELTNCTANGNSLQKTSGRDDSPDAGGRSMQSIESGDCYLEFGAPESNRLRFCGLTHSPTGTDLPQIDFAIKLTTYDVAEVRENNVYRTEVRYRAGDVFRITILSGVVTYFKNDAPLTTSFKTPTYPLMVQARFISLGGRIDNAVIGKPQPGGAADWTMYQHDPAHTGYALGSRLNKSTIGELAESWRASTGGPVSGTPLVAGGMIFAGSWDGRMYAFRQSDGSQVWSYFADTTTDNCQGQWGIDSTAALAEGKLFFGSAACVLYALDPASGNLIWKTQLADPTQGYHNWSSPLVYEGKVYVGLASHCDHPCVRGEVLCVNESDGRVRWRFYTAPQGGTGAGVWSSFAVDPSRDTVYATSGNFCEGDDTYGDSIIALNADTGSLRWAYKNEARDRDVENLDFGASPVLFDIAGVPALAAGSKDGHCYALNRVTGQLLWDSRVTDGSTVGGIISSPAAAYGLVFMGASVEENKAGKVVALDQRDGRIVWEASQPAPVIGAASVAGGAVFIGGMDGVLRAYDALTGAELWSARRATMFGGVSISADHVFIGSADGNIYSFGLIRPAPRQSITILSPAAGEQWRKKGTYSVRWSATSSVSKVDVSISRDGGNTWELLADDVDASAGSVTVTPRKPRSESAVVQVTDSADSTVFGRSAVFSIR